VGTGAEIFQMDIAQNVRPHETNQFIVAFEIDRMILKALAAEIGFAELIALDHRAHSTVKHQNSGLDVILQAGKSFFSIHFLVLMRLYWPYATGAGEATGCRRMPNTLQIAKVRSA